MCIWCSLTAEFDLSAACTIGFESVQLEHCYWKGLCCLCFRGKVGKSLTFNLFPSVTWVLWSSLRDKQRRKGRFSVKGFDANRPVPSPPSPTPLSLLLLINMWGCFEIYLAIFIAFSFILSKGSYKTSATLCHFYDPIPKRCLEIFMDARARYDRMTYCLFIYSSPIVVFYSPIHPSTGRKKLINNGTCQPFISINVLPHARLILYTSIPLFNYFNSLTLKNH